jgi:VCBS repeat-containing protein
MGLYGTLIVEAGTNLAYAGVSYDAEVPLLYSEVDPDLHAAVASGSYGSGTPGAPSSTLHYAPKFFLVNGESYTPGVTAPITTGIAGSRTLLRLLNAGLNTRVPVLQGLDMSIVAEDGKPYPYAKTQYSATLAAMKTMDAVIVPAADGEFPIYDRRLGLTNNTAAPGGLLRLLRTGGGVLAQGDAYTVSEDTILTVPAPGVLGNDLNPAGGTLTASIATPAANGTVTLNADGSFTYQPNLNFAGADSFAYQASNGSQTANATVTLTVTPVNDPPVAVADTATTTAGTAVVIDVLANDVDPDGSLLALIAVGNPSPQGGTVAVSGPTLTYTPPAGFTGVDTFVYVIADDQNLLAIGTVAVTVQ